jgi:hypothetical protein
MPIDKDADMTTLVEALTAEREKRRQDGDDASTKRQVGRAVLLALAQRLNAEPLPTWSFTCTVDEILIARTNIGARQQVGAWTVGEALRLVLGGEKTEWITAESCARVLDEAVQITAKFIVDADTRDCASQSASQAPLNFVGRSEVRELPRRV